MAQAAGLVDMLGTLEDAVLRAGQLAKIPDPVAAERLLLPKPRGLFDEFLGVSGIHHPYPHEAQTSEAIAMRIFALFAQSGVNDALVTRLSSKFRLLSLVASGQPLMLLPAVVEIR
jgi:ClpP class serine protease